VECEINCVGVESGLVWAVEYQVVDVPRWRGRGRAGTEQRVSGEDSA
jgi:hypothetical protein